MLPILLVDVIQRQLADVRTGEIIVAGDAKTLSQALKNNDKSSPEKFLLRRREDGIVLYIDRQLLTGASALKQAESLLDSIKFDESITVGAGGLPFSQFAALFGHSPLGTWFAKRDRNSTFFLSVSPSLTVTLKTGTKRNVYLSPTGRDTEWDISKLKPLSMYKESANPQDQLFPSIGECELHYSMIPARSTLQYKLGMQVLVQLELNKIIQEEQAKLDALRKSLVEKMFKKNLSLSDRDWDRLIAAKSVQDFPDSVRMSLSRELAQSVRAQFATDADALSFVRSATFQMGEPTLMFTFAYLGDGGKPYTQGFSLRTVRF